MKLRVQEEPLRKGPHGAAPARERVNGRARGFALAHLKHQDLEHLPRASPAARRTRPGETGTAPASPQSSSPCRYSLATSSGGENLQGWGPRWAAPPPGSAPRSPRAKLRPRTAANSGRHAALPPGRRRGRAPAPAPPRAAQPRTAEPPRLPKTTRTPTAGQPPPPCARRPGGGGSGGWGAGGGAAGVTWLVPGSTRASGDPTSARVRVARSGRLESPCPPTPTLPRVRLMALRIRKSP